MAEEQVGPEPREQGGGGGCAKGCLIALLVVVVLVAIGAVLVSMYWRSWASSMGVTVVEAAIQQSEMPEAEQAEVMEQVRRLADAWENKEISDQQARRIIEGFGDSPLMASIMVFGIEAQFIESSGLSDEEKAEARVTLNRFASGVINEQIDEQTQDRVFGHVSDVDGQGDRTLRESVTDEELREFLADAKAAADEAGVPEEVEEVDPSDELKRIIDEAMRAPAAGAAPAEQPPEDDAPTDDAPADQPPADEAA